jgi:hypothetical protein
MLHHSLIPKVKVKVKSVQVKGKKPAIVERASATYHLASIYIVPKVKG